MISVPVVSLAGQVIFLVLLGTFPHSAGGSSPIKLGNAVPWERQYKIKPNEKNRLTPADVLGPDGIVYPNWTKCGVQGGIPKVKAVTSIEDFGAKADDDADDSRALAKACEAAGKMGGGAVLLGEGIYYLDRPVTVRHDDVVIRGTPPCGNSGQGPGKTRLIFRYSIPKNGVVFYNPPSGSRVGRNTRLEMHCKPSPSEGRGKPAGLMKMTMMVDETHLALRYMVAVLLAKFQMADIF